MSNEGSDESFELKAEDCARLQLEAFQFHHRYICLLQLEDFSAVVRDTLRNLELFDLVRKHAESEELAWTLQQFRPQLLMIHTRARATQSLLVENFNEALRRATYAFRQRHRGIVARLHNHAFEQIFYRHLHLGVNEHARTRHFPSTQTHRKSLFQVDFLGTQCLKNHVRSHQLSQ